MKAFYSLRIHDSVFLSAAQMFCRYSIAYFYSNGFH